jgi:hypothetical protein
MTEPSTPAFTNGQIGSRVGAMYGVSLIGCYLLAITDPAVPRTLAAPGILWLMLND